MRRRLAAWDVAIGLARLAAGLTQVRRTGGRGPLLLVSSVRRYGLTHAALGALATRRDPDGLALVDDEGELSYAGLDQRAAGVAASLAARAEPARVGVLCRNGRGFVIAVLAAGRVGADTVLLDPDLPPAALNVVLDRERVEVLLVDEPVPDGVDLPAIDIRTAGDTTCPGSRAGRGAGRLVVLTSGTTGGPKGAHRGPARLGQAVPVATLVRGVRLRAGEPMVLLPPMFHGYGLGFLALALGFGTPVLLSRRFDPDRAVELLRRYEARTLVAVPAMLARVVRALPGDVPPVRVVVSAAGQLHPAVSEAVIEAFGPVLVNLYGSTEDGWSTLATPADLVAAPGTIGRPASGVRVEVLDDDGRPVPHGMTGHLCVGSRLEFSHYTGGGTRRRLGGLADTGDLGHRAPSGLLFVDGRADDLVVTGGENVLVTEVEGVLLAHPEVADVRVDGLPDAELGARLVATVVPRTQPAREGLAEELVAFVVDRLGWPRRPREVRFAADLPVTATGKHRRSAH